MKTIITIILTLLIISCSKEEQEQKESLKMVFILPTFLKPCGEPKSVVLIIKGIEHHSKLNVIAGGWKMDSVLVDSGTNIITGITLLDENGVRIYDAVGYFDLERFDVITESNPLKVFGYPKIGAGLAVVCY